MNATFSALLLCALALTACERESKTSPPPPATAKAAPAKAAPANAEVAPGPAPGKAAPGKAASAEAAPAKLLGKWHMDLSAYKSTPDFQGLTTAEQAHALMTIETMEVAFAADGKMDVTFGKAGRTGSFQYAPTADGFELDTKLSDPNGERHEVFSGRFEGEALVLAGEDQTAMRLLPGPPAPPTAHETHAVKPAPDASAP